MQVVGRHGKEDTSDLPTIEAYSCTLPWNLQAFGNVFVVLGLTDLEAGVAMWKENSIETNNCFWDKSIVHINWFPLEISNNH